MISFDFHHLGVVFRPELSRCGADMCRIRVELFTFGLKAPNFQEMKVLGC